MVNIKQISGEDVRKSFFSGDTKMSTVFAPTGYVDVRSRHRKTSEDANVL